MFIFYGIEKEQQLIAMENSSDPHTSSSDEPRDVRIIIIGKTGSGKSSMGNSILGCKKFDSSLFGSSKTAQCSYGSLLIDRTVVRVVDTPGFFCTNKSKEELTNEVTRGMRLVAPGPNAFLFTFPIGSRWTEEEEATLERAYELFGKEMKKFCILVFTKSDELRLSGLTERQYLSEQKQMKNVIKEFGERVLFFDNRTTVDRLRIAQVHKLLVMVMDIYRKNGFYTSETFATAEEEMLRLDEVYLQKYEKEISSEKAKAKTNEERDLLDKTWRQRARENSCQNIIRGVGFSTPVKLAIAAGAVGIFAAAILLGPRPAGLAFFGVNIVRKVSETGAKGVMNVGVASAKFAGNALAVTGKSVVMAGAATGKAIVRVGAATGQAIARADPDTVDVIVRRGVRVVKTFLTSDADRESEDRRIISDDEGSRAKLAITETGYSERSGSVSDAQGSERRDNVQTTSNGRNTQNKNKEITTEIATTSGYATNTEHRGLQTESEVNSEQDDDNEPTLGLADVHVPVKASDSSLDIDISQWPEESKNTSSNESKRQIENKD